jgi:hypothetical protein
MGHYFNTLDRRQSRVLGGADARKGEKVPKAVVDGAHSKSLAWCRVLVLACGLDLCSKQSRKSSLFTGNIYPLLKQN